MELVPEEELEASSRGGSAPPADRRALKVDSALFLFFFILYREQSVMFSDYDLCVLLF